MATIIMDTLQVNIAYRPVRVCWAIKEGDFAAFREAVRINCTLWGGRFNPIVIVDESTEAHAIQESFRADIIIPIGDTPEVIAFGKEHNHLNSSLTRTGIFVGDESNRRVQLLDLQNMVSSRIDTPDWRRVIDAKPRSYSWDSQDTLADVLMIQLGQFPPLEQCGTDYKSMLAEAAKAEDYWVENGRLSAQSFQFPSIANLCRYGVTRHHSVRPNWSWPGFYVGDATNLLDLVTCWNLRACDISVLFVDREEIDRYEELIPYWKEHTSNLIAQSPYKEEYHYAIWARRTGGEDRQAFEDTRALIGNEPVIMCNIDSLTWNANSLVAPAMHLKESSSLGVISEAAGKYKVTFSLSDRPYASDAWFHDQHLIASLDFIGGLYGREDFTLDPPCIPELNEFYSRAMHLHGTDIRIEPERIGVMVSAYEVDNYLYALATNDLFKAAFKQAGFDARISSSGLLTRQLITQLGGLQGTRVFKVPGARQLLKTHGPSASFSKRSALQIIGRGDPGHAGTSFKDHEDLYLEYREPGTKLTPAATFAYMVNRGLFRIGTDLLCPRCELKNWLSIDDVRLLATCQMCGHEFATTPQLLDSDWAFRRSGVLGTERNVQGAIPVALTLQQLDTTLNKPGGQNSYSVSLDLAPLFGQLENPCEVDFAWMIPGNSSRRTQIIIGECKDRGFGSFGDGNTINADDVRNLKTIADSFPKNRYEVFILLAKLTVFTDDEIHLARSLNEPRCCRVIMLTDRELEPYHLYDRTSKLFDVERFSSTAAGLARNTAKIFLNPPSLSGASEENSPPDF